MSRVFMRKYAQVMAAHVAEIMKRTEDRKEESAKGLFLGEMESGGWVGIARNPGGALR